MPRLSGAVMSPVRGASPDIADPDEKNNRRSDDREHDPAGAKRDPEPENAEHVRYHEKGYHDPLASFDRVESLAEGVVHVRTAKLGGKNY